MTATTQTIATGSLVTIEQGKHVGKAGQLIGLARGWCTVHVAGGEHVKVRPSHLALLEETKPQGDPKPAKPATTPAPAEEQDDEESGPRKMTDVLAKYRAAYVPSMSISGNKTMHNGDVLAMAMEGLTPEEAIAMAETLSDFARGELLAKYAHLNKGQKRMNAGNRIRAALKRGDLTAEQIEEYNTARVAANAAEVEEQAKKNAQ